MKLNDYLQIEPPVVINTLPKMSFSISTAKHSSGEPSMVLSYFYTPTELLNPTPGMTNEKALNLIHGQEVLGQLVLTKTFLNSDIFISAIQEVLEAQ